jgi:formylmethanofuran dehydrogenase subunit E
MRQPGTIKIAALVGAFMLAGCSTPGHAVRVGRGAAHEGAHHGGSAVPERYERQLEDPEWLARLGTFHGHLGPWVVIGHMIGTDALHRLDTPGYFEIEVVCWMPPEHQRQPWSCILDGLQVGSGATMGKQNIRFAWSAEMASEKGPVVQVLLHPSSERLGAGVEYRLRDDLTKWLATMKPDRVETMSRELATRTPESLFEVRTISAGKGLSY